MKHDLRTLLSIEKNEFDRKVQEQSLILEKQKAKIKKLQKALDEA